MKPRLLLPVTILLVLLIPVLAQAQVSAGVSTMHTVLDNVYNQMVPLCANMVQIAQAIAGLGTIFYIGYRVWKHIARAEPIDFFPLLRPFVMILLIGMFPTVLSTLNFILSPSVTYTAALVQNSNAAVQDLLTAEVLQGTGLAGTDQNPVLMTPNPQGTQQGWDKYAQPSATTTSDGGGFWSAIGSGFKFLAGGFEASFRYVFKFLMSILLEMLYYAASLCIDTIRVFQLIVLAILGPLAFAFSCYDSFQNSLTHWLQRYINIYLWLPIANILGAILGQIEQNMIQIDLDRMQSGTISMFSATDIAYLIFLIIGIVGYLTIPGLANYIVHTHGPNPLTQAVNKVGMMAIQAVTGGAGGAAGAAGAAGGAGAGAAGGGGAASAGVSAGAGASAPNQFNHDKIAG